MEVLMHEDRLLVTTAGREVFRVAPATAWRWALRGVGGVRLESFKVGGLRYTSREACQRFLDRINGIVENPPPRAAQASRAAAAARRLDEIGI
jgi:Protein of unknown function (DUF1580)